MYLKINKSLMTRKMEVVFGLINNVPTLLDIHSETRANSCKLHSSIGCRSQFFVTFLSLSL